jgi:signal transduction histidine kinase
MSDDPVTSFGPRLRRLRRRLVLASTLVAVVGVGLLAVALSAINGQVREEEMLAEMDRRSTATRSLLYYDATGTLQVEGLIDDEAIVGSPQVYVVERWQGVDRVVFAPEEPQVEVDLLALAGPAISSGEERIDERATTADGDEVWVMMRPFYHDVTDEIVGVALVTGDPDFASASLTRLVWLTWLGAAALALVLAIGSRIVVNRSLRPAAEALAQQERFVADAAHEIRRPLAAIRTTAERGVTGPAVPALHRTIEIVDWTAEMVSDLLNLARIDAMHDRVEGRRLRLDQLAESVAHDIATATGADVQFHSPEPVTVTGDPRMLGRAIFNMVSNAAKHGRVDGEAIVDVEVEPSVVRVLDRGPGFGDEVGAVFDRFHTGASGTGSGLGLALVAAVARAHGGHAAARNRTGGGAEVELVLDG